MQIGVLVLSLNNKLLKDFRFSYYAIIEKVFFPTVPFSDLKVRSHDPILSDPIVLDPIVGSCEHT